MSFHFILSKFLRNPVFLCLFAFVIGYIIVNKQTSSLAFISPLIVKGTGTQRSRKKGINNQNHLGVPNILYQKENFIEIIYKPLPTTAMDYGSYAFVLANHLRPRILYENHDKAIGYLGMRGTTRKICQLVTIGPACPGY